MMRPAVILALLTLSACAAAPSPSDEAQAVEQFMWNYTKAWNRHDAGAIARDFYRTGPSVDEQQANLEKSFENLRAQGYHHSDIFEIKACITGADTAFAAMKFSRLKADGEPLPPKDRASSYALSKYADGWRITKVGATQIKASDPLVCPAS